MTFYNILDFIFFLILFFLIYHSYVQKTYLKIFEYFKIFFILSISAKFAPESATLLQKFHITKADTYTTLILIAFAINLLILYFGWDFIFKILSKFIDSQNIKSLLAKVITVIEISVLSTLFLYVAMQFYPAKKYIYPSVKKSYTYPKIEKFYTHFLNDNFVFMILNQDTATNHKELLFKSFKNSF
ncbi:hypothetical protein LXN10_03655 [Arcobacter sp. KX21116]|uniref:hypothetical protein n=1 Tax=Arcobacter iocasae TaxID=2906515 RepID=UPI0035D4A192